MRLVALMLALAVCVPLPARSQSGAAKADEMQRAAQLAVLVKQAFDARNPTEAIRLAAQALDLESTLKTWPLPSPREAIRASLWNKIGQSYLTRGGTTFADDMDSAIAAFDQALGHVSRSDQSELWVGLQNNLGIAYVQRVRGERAENIERGIGCYEAALAVATKERMPIDWARLQMNLGNAYRERPGGDRASNLDKALAAQQSALTVYTRDAQPFDWARLQANLGATYFVRIRGERADNIERAIAALGAALTVFTREQASERGSAQHNLGLAYQQRSGGDRTDNLERAITSLEASLTVRTRERLPLDWAATQTSLGTAYVARLQGDRGENLERAVAAHEAALTVYRPEQDPIAWARVTTNLGNALSMRIRGDRGDNIERSIAAYRAALTGFTRERIPHEWAKVHSNLGVAYTNRVRGSRAENLQAAIAAFEQSLTVRTRDAEPRDHLTTARQLGQAALESRDWTKAGGAYATAREAFLLLFGQGLDETEARDLIAQAGPLFAEAAFAQVQLGQTAKALQLASEGKARLLSVALRLQGLDLAPDKRKRLEELRGAVRAQSRAYEAADGGERTSALDRLAAVRRELLAIIAASNKAEVQSTGATLSAVHDLVPAGGAIVMPIVTKVGGKILLVTLSDGKPVLTTLDIPELYSQRVETLIRGTGVKVGLAGGWLGAFNIQYLPPDEFNARIGEWTGAIERIGPELWRLFVSRLDVALRERGITPGARIVWLPSGALGLLPLALAHERASDVRLGEKYEVVNAPSLEALTQAVHQIAHREQPSLAAVANPTGDLPFTEIESALVAAHFTARPQLVLDKSNATPQAVLAGLKDKRYWHFSSHGRFDWGNARNAGLIMKNAETLTIGALLDAEGSLGRPRLVVLSACETGLYDTSRNADEFVGLPATFMQLGAAGVLGTLWQVDDLATSLLMAKFYALHLAEGLAPPTALARAQVWLRNASQQELSDYARSAGRAANLDATMLAELESGLATRRRAASSRFAAISERLQMRAGDDKPIAATAVDAKKPRPFAHPYYWGGFTYTGL